MALVTLATTWLCASAGADEPLPDTLTDADCEATIEADTLTVLMIFLS
jgi:hypothetical protein